VLTTTIIAGWALWAWFAFRSLLSIGSRIAKVTWLSLFTFVHLSRRARWSFVTLWTLWSWLSFRSLFTVNHDYFTVLSALSWTTNATWTTWWTSWSWHAIFACLAVATSQTT
jgi:hypothetical protein